jgi:hypothetical protein
MEVTSVQKDRYGREFVVQHGETEAQPDLSAADATAGAQDVGPSTLASEVLDFADYYEG